ncbi:MAG: peptidylprolyl isomerase [Planctomycetota bacterium]|nr:peptidylprolyl isomerase [Planctomycetota bacterium]
MAKHKAATEITIAQEEQSAFATLVFKYKWPALSVLAVASAAVLYTQSASQAATESDRAVWGELYEANTSDDRVATLEALTAKNPSATVSAWAYMDLAQTHLLKREYGEATVALQSAQELSPALLGALEFPIGPDGSGQSLLAHLEASVAQEAAWTLEHPSIFENPPLPENSPRVELMTNLGPIIVGLESAAAPGHSANFLTLVKEGYYNGTRFHRVQPGGFIQGGDPNSRDEDASTWGLGGPDKTVPAEESGLIHAEGVLAAAKVSGAVNSSGSQFYLTASPQYQFDGNYVVYGRVLEGLDLVKDASNAEIREDKAETPVEPVTIISSRIL